MIPLLLVDDEPAIRRGLRDTVPWERYGCQVVGEAANGTEALAELSRLSPRIVVTDIQMPVMDGLELSERIRRDHPGVAVILLTGFEEFAFAKRAIASGVDEYLLKPISILELEVAIGRIRDRLTDAERVDLAIRELRPDAERILWDRLFLDSSRDAERLVAGIEALGMRPGNGACQLLLLSPDLPRPSLARPGSSLAPGLDAGLSIALKEAAVGLGESLSLVREGLGCLILWGGAAGTDAIGDSARAARDSLRRELGLGATVVAVDSPAGLTALDAAWREAQSRLGRRFREGKGLFLPDGASPVQRVSISSLHSMQAIKAMLFSPDPQRAAPRISDLAEELFSTRASRAACLDAANAVLDLLYRRLDEGGVSAGIPDRRSVERELEGFQTLHDLRDGLRELLTAAAAALVRSGEAGYSVIVHTAMHIVRVQYARPSLVSAIAEKLGITANHLGRKFREETGGTLSGFIHKTRLEKARELVSEGKLKIFEVAEAVGISDYKYFNEAFKKAYGIRPSDLRRGTPTGKAEEGR